MPAQATLVYVKKPAAENSVVYVAADDGSKRRRVAIGRAPAVSPDGNWIAWIGKDDGLDQLMLQRAGGGATLVVMHSRALDAIHFSPDSTMVGAVLSGRRLRIYVIPSDATVPVGSGFIRGWTFSPDSKTIAWGRSTKSDVEAAGDVHGPGRRRRPADATVEDRRRAEPALGRAGHRVSTASARATATPRSTTSGRSSPTAAACGA